MKHLPCRNKFLIALGIIVLNFALGHLNAYALNMIGIITAKDAKLLSLPKSDASAIAMLKRGAEVKVLAIQNEWLHIQFGGQVGYILNRHQTVHMIDLESGTDDEDTVRQVSSSDKNLEQLQSEAAIISRKIDKSKEEVARYTQNEVNLLIELNKIDHSLDRQMAKIREKRNELESLENAIKASRIRFKDLAQQIEDNESYVASRLATLYKLNQMGSVQFLASAGTFYDMIFRKKNLEAILAHDQDVRENLIADRKKIKAVLDQLSQQQVNKYTTQKKLNSELDGLARQKTRRSRLLADVRSKRSLEQAALESLQAAAAVLDDTIEAFNAQKPSESPSSQSFETLKGLLKMPVEGKIISSFGSYTNLKLNVTNFRSGVDIQASRGSTIQSVFDGHVLYADWFKGYGNMIIIDHGDSYYTVYAHLDGIAKTKGDRVKTGEAIGTVGDSGSMVGPALYFEIRYHGKPLDPMQWIQNG